MGEVLGRELRGYAKDSWVGSQETQWLKYDGATLTYYKKKGTHRIQRKDGKSAETKQLLEGEDIGNGGEDEKEAPQESEQKRKDKKMEQGQLSIETTQNT